MKIKQVQYECIKSELKCDYEKKLDQAVKLLQKKAESNVSYMLLNQITHRPSESKNPKSVLKDTELQRIETITRQMQLKKLTHPRIANLKD
jgi:hypothetical protein